MARRSKSKPTFAPTRLSPRRVARSYSCRTLTAKATVSCCPNRGCKEAKSSSPITRVLTTVMLRSAGEVFIIELAIVIRDGGHVPEAKGTFGSSLICSGARMVERDNVDESLLSKAQGQTNADEASPVMCKRGPHARPFAIRGGVAGSLGLLLRLPELLAFRFGRTSRLSVPRMRAHHLGALSLRQLSYDEC